MAQPNVAAFSACRPIGVGMLCRPNRFHRSINARQKVAKRIEQKAAKETKGIGVGVL
jgi:hypothetical protein